MVQRRSFVLLTCVNLADTPANRKAPGSAGTAEGPGHGPVLFLDLFHGRDELVVYPHMWCWPDAVRRVLLSARSCQSGSRRGTG